MIICGNCGFKCQSGSKFCTKCSSKLVQNVNNTNKSKFISNTDILLGEGEVNVKSYHCTTWNKGFLSKVLSLSSDGYLSVTNKRVIFFGDGGKQSSLVSEVPLESVTGVNSYTGRGTNIRGLIFGIILTMIFTFLIGSLSHSTFGIIFSIVIFILGIFITLRMNRYTNYTLSIFSNASDSCPISIGDRTFGRGLTGQGAKVSMNTMPTAESLVLRRELGALILDIQTMGTLGVDKWINGGNKTKFNNTNGTNINNMVDSKTIDLNKSNEEVVTESNNLRNDRDIF